MFKGILNFYLDIALIGLMIDIGTVYIHFTIVRKFVYQSQNAEVSLMVLMMNFLAN